MGVIISVVICVIMCSINLLIKYITIYFYYKSCKEKYIQTNKPIQHLLIITK